MSNAADEFSRSVKDTVAKRAGNVCSNPDCQTLTVGPAGDASALSVGEAAHIFGARQGSARYRSEMESIDRASIANAIWLCRNCHRQVDSDETRFPPELLFEWRREHEMHTTAAVGVTGAKLRRRVERRMIDDIGPSSYAAEQIAVDKPDAWEYRLTAELLRVRTEYPIGRWKALSRMLYSRPIIRVTEAQSLEWYRDRVAEMDSITAAISGLINGGFQDAWGAPGEPGSVSAISQTCGLFGEVVQFLLDWEERVRFARLETDFETLRETLIGVGGCILDQVSAIPKHMIDLFSGSEPVTGKHEVVITIKPPDGWEEETSRVMDEIVQKKLRDMETG